MNHSPQKQAVDVRLEKLAKSFGSTAVLHDLDLHVRAGEMLALLGPSGCGKTTALRLIAGLETANSGRVLIGEQDVSQVPVNRRGVGIVFQAYSLFPHLTAGENVAYGLRVRRVAAAQRARRVDELLALVGLADHREKYPHQLSGGQQQRIALARAIAVEPRVLLLDEPLSALDARVRVQLREEIKRVQHEAGTTTIMVTHDQEEALTMADRVAVMNAGRIEQLGSPHQVYSEPLTPFVSEFVGVSNRLPAEAVDPCTVRVLGRSVATRRDDLPAGWRGVALIRPENLRLQPASEGEATVVAAVLRGPLTSLRIEHPAVSSGMRVDVAHHEAQAFSPGTRVVVTLLPSPLVLDEDTPAAQPEVTR